jgi:hypothetical protein
MPPEPVEMVHPEDEDEFLTIARELKVGTWFEFVDAEGGRDRAKLSWISPISGKYLFVNSRGLKVCDKTLHALAAELRRESASILVDVPLFDRALDAVVARLRSARAHAAAKPATDSAAPAPAS